MAIHQIPTTPTTPRKTITSLFSPSKTSDANHISPPKPSQTFSEKMMQENIENAEVIIGKWDPTRSSVDNFTSLFQENRQEAKEFVKCVDDLRRAMDFLVSHHSGSNHQLVVANKTMKTAMLRLEKEFHHILSANRDYFNPESVSSGSSRLSRSLSFENSDEEERDNLLEFQMTMAERAKSDLKLIAESMISSGYSKECGRIYRTTQKSIVDEELSHIGIKSHTTSQINRMDEDALTHQVNKWIDAAKIAVRRLFRGERLLCDHIFSVSETIKQACVAHTTMEGAINLFKFPELVAKSKRCPDKIFRLMNLFETISDLWPEIESIFSYESLSPIKLQALSSMHKLSASAQTTLSQFVSSIQQNSSKTPVPGGGIHPLTFSVMNYVSLLAENSGVLSDIIADDSENATKSPFPESYFEPTSPPAAGGVPTKLAWIILVLLCKLDSKAELYKDIGQSYLFLANNLHFVAERVGTTAPRVLLGQDWLHKLQKKVKTYAANYESVSWGRVLSSLQAEKFQETPGEMKERFRRFSAEFEAACRKQRTWVVPDPRLRDEIKVSVAGKVVAAYGEFYGRYTEVMSGERNLEVMVRLSPDNLGNYLSDLFHESSAVVWSWGEEDSTSSMTSLSRCL